MSIWWRQRGRTRQAVYSISVPFMMLAMLLALLATVIVFAITSMW